MRKAVTLFIFSVYIYAAHGQNDSMRDVTRLLDLSLEQLMNIKVVTASGYLQTTSEAPSTITVITVQQIAARGYEQLEDALRDIPGIDMIHINGYAPTLIYFRGMYGAENLRALLMVDGVVENNILGSNDLAGPAYSLHNTERIEIIWGPVSALYGANAFGGVINIISKKGADINGFHVTQGFGSFNTSFEKVSLGMRKSAVEFAVEGTLYNSDGPKFGNRDPNYSGSYVDKAYSFNGALSYYGKKSKTTLSYRTYKTPMGWGTYANSPTVYLRLPQQGYNNSGILGIIQSNIRGEKSGLDDSYLRTFFIQNDYGPNEKLKFTTRIIYRETGTGENSFIYVTTDGRKLIRVPVTSYSKRIAGDLSANYSLSENHKFSAGIDFYQDNVEAGVRRSTLDLSTIYLIDGRDTVTNIHATFLPRLYDIRNNTGSYFQYILNTGVFGKTNVTLGVRFDHNSYFGNALSPRIAIVNKPSKKLTFKFQFGSAFRAPTNLEIHQTPSSATFQLKKEKMLTYELNAIYAFSNNARLQLNGFRNDLTDVIVLGNLSGLNPDKNPGIITVNGLESILDVEITKNISGFMNITYQDPRGENLITHFKGQIPGVARIKGNAGITMQVNDLFTITATGNLVGNRRTPRTNPYGSVKGYFLGNCVISSGKLFQHQVTASLNVRNVLNAKWLDPGFRTADGFLYATVLEQPGRSVVFKISVGLF